MRGTKDHRQFTKVLVVLGLALTFGLLVLSLPVLKAPQAQANTRAPTDTSLALDGPPARPALAPALSITKTASSDADPAGGATASAGSIIKYRVTVKNTGDITLSVVITDQLPTGSLTDPQCLDSIPLNSLSCTPIETTIEFTTKNATPPTQTITVVDKVEWVTSTLAPGESVTGQFQGLVACRPDGFVFTNFAIVEYEPTSGPSSPNVDVSNLVNTQVQIKLTGANGQPKISEAPTLCTQDAGGFYDMDWGDYDADGDLDVVLVSGDPDVGVVVYRNDGGQFTRISIEGRTRLRSARWGDFDGNGLLDLLIAGYWDFRDGTGPSGPYNYTGYNQIRLNQGGDTFQLVENGTDDSGTEYTFQSNDGMFRAAVANFDDTDNRSDVALGNEYDITNGCAIQVNKNIGAPNYFVATLNWANANLHCLQEEARVRGLAWGDYDNDGLLDLAAGIDEFGGTDSVSIFRQTATNSFSTSTTVYSITDFISVTGISPPYDVRWGDYDNDGFLDLAAALGNQVRIYHNNQGVVAKNAAIIIDAAAGLETTFVRAIDWVDFDGDGQLELAVADRSVKIYELDPASSVPVSFVEVSDSGSGTIYSIRGVDAENDGDFDIAYTNFSERAFLFSVDAPFLARQATSINNAPGSGIAWGDVDEGGLNPLNDLLIGASSNPGNTIFFNTNGQLGSPFNFVIPSNDVAFGDVDADGDLDIAAALNASNLIYKFDSQYNLAFDWRSGPSNSSQDLIFGDFDQDNAGLLELVIANANTANTFYRNEGLQSSQSDPTWSTPELENSQGIAWGYFDSDVFPDFAIANDGQVNRVYRNNGDNTFSVVSWNPIHTNDASRSVAWGDYDSDGDMDLAVGNFGQENYIYENQNGILDQTPVWSSTQIFNTTSLAWGDWNNDGDLDLAVGNDGQPDQVYDNLNSQPGTPRLFWLWRSGTPLQTKDLTWGDVDGDGDLDLAVAATGQNGYYKNNYVLPAHRGDASNNPINMPLPLNSSYLSIARPVTTTGPIWYRNVLSEDTSLDIPVNFTVYDPDGSEQYGSRDDLNDVQGQYADTAKMEFEYSVNGGGQWQPANGTASFGGGSYTFDWEAGQDLNGADAASDDVRIRITMVHQNRHGLTQRASSSAVSPPFRVRNLSCVWPENSTISFEPSVITAGNVVTFTGGAFGGGQGSLGQIFFDWDFGNDVMTQGQVVVHNFQGGGSRVISLTVSGNPCPVTRPDFVTITVNVGSAPTIYLPLITKDGPAATSVTGTDIDPSDKTDRTSPGKLGDLPHNPNLTPISDLVGHVRSGDTTLQWSPGSPDEAILGYRLYRSPMGRRVSFQLLADLPAGRTTFADTSATCGQMYLITTYDEAGESRPSLASYFSPPCR